MNPTLKFKIWSLLFIGCIFFLDVARVEAGEFPNPVGRAQLIENEMKCVSRHLDAQDDIGWQDVCYVVPSRTVGGEPRREVVIAEYLDRAERRQRNEVARDPEMITVYADSSHETGPLEIPVIIQSERRPDRYEERRRARYQPTRDEFSDEGVKVRFNVGVGERVDDLKWNIAGNTSGTNPNVLAEYKWKEVKEVQIKAKSQVELNQNYILDGQLAWGQGLDGNVSVSEYDGNNRTNESSRTLAVSKDGNTLDLSAGLGYRMLFNDDYDLFQLENMSLTFLGGYSYHEQNLTMTDGNQVIDTSMTPSLGPFSGLDSSYDTEWKGPWLGLELGGDYMRLSGLFRMEYHFVDYYAEGRLNLQPSFQQPKSFEHDASGEGYVFNLGIDYRLTQNWALNFSADYQDWHAREGTDRLFLSNGSQTESKLNDVDWNSYALMLGATFQFN